MRWAYFLLVASALWWIAPPAHAAQEEPPVALIGVPGLLWDDVDPHATPNLWRLAGESDLGSVSVKTVGTLACPFDGWLSVSAGVRSAVGQRCGLPPEPERTGEGARVPGFDGLRARRDGTYAGTLGAAVHAAGHCTTAVGPGAALALADADGKVDVYAPEPAALADWSRCRVLAVDVDELIRPYLAGGHLPAVPDALGPERRREAVRAADAEVGAALAKLPAGAQVVLSGIGDHGSVPHLRVAMWKRAEASGGLLGTASTRRGDIVIITDTTPTVLTAAGIPVPPTVIGLPWQAGERLPLEEAVAELRRADMMGTGIRNTTGLFFTGFAVITVSFYAIAYYVLSRRRNAGAVGVVALGLAAVPVSTYAVNVFPWGHGPYPIALVITGVVAIASAITAFAVLGPWRRGPLGPPGVVAAIIGIVMVADLLTGTNLQFNSLMGYTAVVGGRYYGLANIPFALLATSVLMTAAVAADHLVRAGRRRAAVALVSTLGVAAMLLAGWPGIGSDFGGVIAFVPGIAVTALLVAGKRVSVLKFVGFCALGGVTVSALAVLDYLRPAPSQTHLGRFVGMVLDGTFMPMILRKLGAMLNTMLSPNLMPIVITGLAFLIFAIMRPGKISAGVVPQAFERAPMLKAGLIGALVSGVVGMLVNDSGTAVLSMVVAVAVPLVLYAGIHSEPLAEPASEEAPVAAKI
ncbi:hypothetical protein [Nonomuraea ferruginea]|uniref:Uncharacterized protein n=1 Tax=Nonomuraea ferruginea TaxID=46174 RepID=A0ABT4SWE6_9ACTN|nr:hypothetical protein [Nonomuraea ferruginea]MDA0641225.1 hypothetical protein [Nonomuraea ferruginea]